MKKRAFLVLLLLISCLTAGYLLYTLEPEPAQHLQSASQIDSLITDTFQEFEFSSNELRRTPVEVDTSFTRIVYRADADPGFSKTTFHYTLAERIFPYDLRTAAVVHFPDEDLHIHVLYNGTVYRTIRLITEESNVDQNRPG